MMKNVTRNKDILDLLNIAHIVIVLFLVWKLKKKCGFFLFFLLNWQQWLCGHLVFFCIKNTVHSLLPATLTTSCCVSYVRGDEIINTSSNDACRSSSLLPAHRMGLDELWKGSTTHWNCSLFKLAIRVLPSLPFLGFLMKEQMTLLSYLGWGKMHESRILKKIIQEEGNNRTFNWDKWGK